MSVKANYMASVINQRVKELVEQHNEVLDALLTLANYVDGICFAGNPAAEEQRQAFARAAFATIKKA